MPMFAYLNSLFRNLFGKPRIDQDLDDEIRSHLQLLTDQKIEEGMNPEQATRAARIELGGVEQIKEQVRAVRAGLWLETVLQDIRFGIRMLRKNPGFTSVAVITLALGIGANTALFSMVDSLLLRPLPVRDSEQITVLAFQRRNGPLRSVFSIPDYLDIKNQTQSTFSGVFGYQLGLDGLSVDGKGDRIESAYVTGNFFSALGIKPALGRFILPSEGENLGADPVIVLSYSYWKTRFASDLEAIGRKVSLNGHLVTIVGVTPPGFDGVNSLISFQAYLPLAMPALVERYPKNFMANRGSRSLNVLGRLSSAKSLEQAQALLAVVGQRLSQQYPDTDAGITIRAIPERRSRLGPDQKNILSLISGLFLGLAALVLLLACMNVASILLARATVREREMAIRAALGAGRRRLMRQLVTESLLLAFAGGAAGILIGLLGINKLKTARASSASPPIPALTLFRCFPRTASASFGPRIATAPSSTKLTSSSPTGRNSRHRWLSAFYVTGINFWIHVLWFTSAAYAFPRGSNLMRAQAGVCEACVSKGSLGSGRKR